MNFIKVLPVFIVITLTNCFCITPKLIPEIKSGSSQYLSNSTTEYHGVFGHDSTYYFAWRMDHQPVIMSFNNNLEFIKENTLYYHVKGLSNASFVDIQYFKDSIYFFYSQIGLKKSLLYARTVNKETLELNNDERIVFNVDNAKGNYPDFLLKKSFEKQQLLLIARTDIFTKNTVLLELMPLNTGLDSMWHRKDILFYNGKRAPYNTKYIIDEQANVHILSTIYEVNNLYHLFSNDNVKNQYLILSYNNSGKNRHQNILTIQNKFVRGAEICPGENGSVICAGTYSQQYEYGSGGLFYTQTNGADYKLEKIKLYNFDKEFLKYLIPERRADEAPELLSFKVKQLKQRPNKNVTMVCEQQFDQEYDNFNDLIVVNFSTEGNILNKNVINKRQSGVDFTSFAFVAPNTSNSTVIFYNDNASNSIEPDYTQNKKSFSFPAPSYLKFAIIDEFGAMRFEKTMERNRKELIPMPVKYYDLLNGSVIIPSERYKEYNIIKVDAFD